MNRTEATESPTQNGKGLHMSLYSDLHLREMNSREPDITVLLTAHNEAKYIQSSLKALAAQDYPPERVEILLIDDRSTDATVERAKELNLSQLRILRLKETVPGLTTRQTALDIGFEAARGEIVLVTDANGRVPRNWIRELSGHLGYRDGAVTAPVVFAGRSPLLSKIQTLDALVNFTFEHWANRHSKPSGLNSANMAVRREAYLQTGGFSKIGFSLMEGYALGYALHREGWSIRYLPGPATQDSASHKLAGVILKMRRRAYDISWPIRMTTFFIFASNLLFIWLAIVFGGFWKYLLLFRYLAGVIGMSFSMIKYGSAASKLLALTFFYEPALMLLGVYVGLCNFFSRTYYWGGQGYRVRAEISRGRRR